MSTNHRISDERLAKLAYAASQSPHLSDQCAAFRELQSLRSASTPAKAVSTNEIEEMIEQLLDAQQDINLAANSTMDQSLCDASALIDKTEALLRRCISALEDAPQQEVVA